MENSIHQTAIVDSDVVLGQGNFIGPNVRIFGKVVIGDNNWIGTGAVIGAYPEHSSLNHFDLNQITQLHGLDIGNQVVIREYVQIHQGLRQATKIGDKSFIMNQSYIAHDCEIGESVVLSSSVLLAGNVKIGDSANLGMGVSVHQGISIGELAMIGMGAVVTRDISNYVKAFGIPAKVKGINTIGLQRAGFSSKQISKFLESI